MISFEYYELENMKNKDHSNANQNALLINMEQNKQHHEATTAVIFVP